MTIRSLANRLDRLDADAVSPDECDGAPTCTVIDDGLRQVYIGSEIPYDPGTAPVCPRCGHVHPIIVEESVVMPDGTNVPSGVYGQDPERYKREHAGRDPAAVHATLVELGMRPAEYPPGEPRPDAVVNDDD